MLCHELEKLPGDDIDQMEPGRKHFSQLRPSLNVRNRTDEIHVHIFNINSRARTDPDVTGSMSRLICIPEAGGGGYGPRDGFDPRLNDPHRPLGLVPGTIDHTINDK
ncbi:unnamed protein product [Pleuronectes platessa]|uniref:Uncharacterized protein n=1 Tax=Pleuronectes platessa TaxID=8262 RepID=A0A9N7VBU8_PLEPL|nr:unnamed protein product [Pleuronectes platessa]